MASTTPNIPFTSSSTIPLWINGKEVTATKTYNAISPLTNKPLYKASAASPADVEAALAAASAALPAWSATKPSARRDLLLRAAAEMEKRKDQLWHLANTEVASTEPYFAFDFADAMEALVSTAGLIQAGGLKGEVITMGEEGRSAMLVREPFGVCVAIAPWNCPCILGLRSFLAPIAMGNTIVVKGSERSPACFWALASIFHAVGLPPGVLNIIIHAPEDGPTITPLLVKHRLVKKINFTGSTAVGKLVNTWAASELKPTLLELGGKAPAIVLDDADLQLAALQCTIGAFLFSGQICMSTERILVHHTVIDKFRPILQATIDQVFSNPDGLVLVSNLPVENNRRFIADAVAKGAKTTYGDGTQALQLATAMKPVVLEGIKPDMSLYYTESFGPIVALFSIQDDEEAIRIANDTDYGLASAVFTEDLRRGLKIAKRIETGAVHINSMSVHDEPALPHGGAKQSGFGRFNGEEGLKEWVRWKTITWRD